jgi:hypothetical protein
MEWCLYYDDGSAFSCLDGPWHEAPNDGVLLVVERVHGRSTFHSGADYYYAIEGECIVATGDAAAILRSLGTPAGDRGPARGVKCGRWTSPSRMEATFARARHEWG